MPKNKKEIERKKTCIPQNATYLFENLISSLFHSSHQNTIYDINTDAIFFNIKIVTGCYSFENSIWDFLLLPVRIKIKLIFLEKYLTTLNQPKLYTNIEILLSGYVE